MFYNAFVGTSVRETILYTFFLDKHMYTKNINTILIYKTTSTIHKCIKINNIYMFLLKTFT